MKMDYLMKLTQSVLPAFIIAGTFGLSSPVAAGNEQRPWKSEVPSERYRTSGDEALPPGIPGITENNTSDMRPREVQIAQEILKHRGYDPGRSDGVLDNDTRAAIREFQRDNALVITGTVDSKTAEVLGMRHDRSG